jgi:spore coat polysaccharide biosynthesis protein SpsF
MPKSVTLIIQARMGSSRLPGKMLLPLFQEKSMLYWITTRLKSATSVDHIVVATSKLDEDKSIVDACNTLHIPCVTGSDWDVLSRFYDAALQFPSDIVVRVCGDSPLINGEIIDFAIEQFHNLNTDYFSNGNEPPLFAEDGFCAEVFHFKDLKEAVEKAEWMSEREHVTPYIKKNPHLQHHWAQFRNDYRYKLSIDTREDFDNVQWLFERMKDPNHSGMDEIMELMKHHPEQHWGHVVWNAGYQKSLKEDIKIHRNG